MVKYTCWALNTKCLNPLFPSNDCKLNSFEKYQNHEGDDDDDDDDGNDGYYHIIKENDSNDNDDNNN